MFKREIGRNPSVNCRTSNIVSIYAFMFVMSVCSKRRSLGPGQRTLPFRMTSPDRTTLFRGVCVIFSLNWPGKHISFGNDIDID